MWCSAARVVQVVLAVWILSFLPPVGLGHSQEFQIDSANQYVYFELIPSEPECGVSEAGEGFFNESGTFEISEPFTVHCSDGAVTTTATQISTIEAHQLTATLVASVQLENDGDPEHLKPVGSGFTTTSWDTDFTLGGEIRQRFTANLETEFLDFGTLSEARVQVELTGPLGTVFAYDLVDETYSLPVIDTMVLGAGSYHLSAKARVNLWDRNEPRLGTFTNHATIAFELIPVPEPSTLLLAATVLAVIAGCWRTSGSTGRRH